MWRTCQPEGGDVERKVLTHLDGRYRTVGQMHHAQRIVAGLVAIYLDQVPVVEHRDTGCRRTELQHLVAGHPGGDRLQIFGGYFGRRRRWRNGRDCDFRSWRRRWKL